MTYIPRKTRARVLREQRERERLLREELREQIRNGIERGEHDDRLHS